MTSLPSGSISWTLDENKEFGLCNMQVPLECSVPCEKCGVKAVSCKKEPVSKKSGVFLLFRTDIFHIFISKYHEAS